MHPLVRYVRNSIARMLAIDVPDSKLITSGMSLTSQAYPAISSMSAFASFPYVRMAVSAIAQDLSGQPLIALVQDGQGHERVVSLRSKDVADAQARRVLANLRRPNPKMTGRALRRQVYTDRLASGNGYLWLPSGTDYLVRMHPALIQTAADRLGLIEGFDVPTLALKIPWSQMLHASDASWRDDQSAGLGESPIYTLSEDLEAEQSARRITRHQAQTGHPSVLVTAKDVNNTYSAESVKAAREAWESQMKNGNAVMFMGDAFEAQVVGLSPKDMAYPQLREANAATVLAFYGVPGTRVGLASANYGTAKQSQRSYWENIQTGAAADWNELFSEYAARTTGEDGIMIEHDLSSVESLQVSYTERQLRVQTWVALGATPMDAARYEGFTDAPLMGATPGGTIAPADRAPVKVDEPQPSRKGKADAVSEVVYAYLQGAAQRAERVIARADGAELDPHVIRETEESRARVALESLIPSDAAEVWAGELAAWSTDAAISFANRSTEDGIARSGLANTAAFSEARAKQYAEAIAK